MYAYIYNFERNFKTYFSLTSCDRSLTSENSRKNPPIAAFLFVRPTF